MEILTAILCLINIAVTLTGFVVLYFDRPQPHIDQITPRPFTFKPIPKGRRITPIHNTEAKEIEAEEKQRS